MSRNALYVQGGPHNWISIAQQLQREDVLIPKYWIGKPENREEIEKEFADIIFHSQKDALRNISPAEVEYEGGKSIDAELLTRYQDYTDTIYRSMDRIDPKYCFNYDERTRHYHMLLSYWIEILDRFDIDVIIFPISPLHTHLYTIYAICKEKDIQTIILTKTKLPYAWFLRENVDSMPEWQMEYEAAELSEISKESRAYINSMRSKNFDAVSTHINKFNTFKSLLSDVRKYPRYLKSLNKEAGSYYIGQGELPENSNKTWGEYILHKFRTSFRKKNLKKTYSELSVKPQYAEDYIYVPLHYQPEVSSVPEGGYYATQKLMIDLLSRNLPPSWKVFVKEHPNQWHPLKKGEHSRSEYHYRDIHNMDNVDIINIDASSKTLIHNARAVSTLTGTAGWEAIVNNIPAITFGNAWYGGCKSVFDVKTESEVQEAMSEIDNQTSQDTFQQVIGFAKLLEDYGFQSHNHVVNYDHVDPLPAEEIVENTSEAISDIVI